MIEVIDLWKSYSDRKILEKVSVSLTDSCIYALLGRNGTGKTTLLTSMVEASFKDSGIVKIDGIPHHQMQAKEHLFYVPDHEGMFLNLTGEEYLKFIAKLYHQSEDIVLFQIEKLSKSLHMENRLRDYISNYSLGMKKKIYLMAAFLSGAKNLIWDEPFNGLDPESTTILKQLLTEHRDRGSMILFSIHNLDLASNFCDRIILLDKNRQLSITDNTKDFEELEQLFFEKCVE